MYVTPSSTITGRVVEFDKIETASAKSEYCEPVLVKKYGMLASASIVLILLVSESRSLPNSTRVMLLRVASEP